MISREKAKVIARELKKGKSKKDALLKAGFKKSIALTQVKRVCSNPVVEEEIKKLSDKADEKALIDRKRIIDEWNKIAFSNIKQTRNESDEALPLHAMPEEVSAAVEELAEIETQIGTSRRVKMHSKPAALKELAKLGGLYPEEGTGESKQIVYVFGNEKD